jgi:hypothetical protein
VLRTPVRAPRANAYAERWVRTVRTECLDWLLILNRTHLERVLRVYVRHYNHQPAAQPGLARPIGHQAASVRELLDLRNHRQPVPGRELRNPSTVRDGEALGERDKRAGPACADRQERPIEVVGSPHFDH